MAPTETKIIPAANSDATTNVVALPTRPEPVTPSEKALSFVKEHPVLTIAGGLAAGLLISTLIPRRANRGLTKRALRFAEAGAAAALSFGQDTLDKAEDGGVVARKKAKILGKQAEKFGGRAAAQAEKLATLAAERAETLSGRAAAKAERLGVAALGTAGVWGHAAAERADKFGHAAAVHAESLGSRASDRLSQIGDKALVQSHRLLGYPKAPVSIIDRLLDTAHGLRARLRR
jgi:hypothetical protein